MSSSLVYIDLFPSEDSKPGAELAECYIGELRITASKDENGEFHLEATTLWENGELRTAKGRMAQQFYKNESKWDYANGWLDMPAWPDSWAVRGQRRLTANDTHYITLQLSGVGSPKTGRKSKVQRSRLAQSPADLLPADVRLATGGPLVSSNDNPLRVMLARLVDAIRVEMIPEDHPQVQRLASEARQLLTSTGEAPKTANQNES